MRKEKAYLLHSALGNNNCLGLVLASLIQVAQSKDYTGYPPVTVTIEHCTIHRCSSHRISMTLRIGQRAVKVETPNLALKA